MRRNIFILEFIILQHSSKFLDSTNIHAEKYSIFNEYLWKWIQHLFRGWVTLKNISEYNCEITWRKKQSDNDTKEEKLQFCSFLNRLQTRSPRDVTSFAKSRVEIVSAFSYTSSNQLTTLARNNPHKTMAKLGSRDVN